MGALRKVEERVLGEVIRDYGVVSEFRKGWAKFRVTLLLCRKDGQNRLVFRQVGKGPLNASVMHQIIEAENMTHLKQSIDDAVELSQP